MQACNNSSLSLSPFVSHFPFHCRSLSPYLPLIVVHDELWTRYLWAWTKLTLWLTLAVSGSFWLSLWFTLSLSLIPAYSDSVWFTLALSGAHWLTRSLLSLQCRCSVAAAYIALHLGCLVFLMSFLLPVNIFFRYFLIRIGKVLFHLDKTYKKISHWIWFLGSNWNLLDLVLPDFLPLFLFLIFPLPLNSIFHFSLTSQLSASHRSPCLARRGEEQGDSGQEEERRTITKRRNSIGSRYTESF